MDGILSVMLLIVIVIALIIAVLAVTNRIIFKMAVRNFARRKIQSVIVISGLMIGTAIISSSLVVQDTMVYMFEVDVYRSLGEVDEDIWGLNSFGTVEYFNESIYETLSENLSSVDGIEAVAPVIADLGAVFDFNTLLGDPSVAILGLDSDVLKNTSFGDLDGHGFYPDSLGQGQAAINSRLANEIDASEGDMIVLSYGAKNPQNPLEPELRMTNFTVTKIIEEKELWGKANYNQRKTVFLEMDDLQLMLNRSGEINHIWISNDGDYKGGEYYTSQVNQTIVAELDKAVSLDNDLSGANLNLEVHDVKADNLESARIGGETIGIMFMIFGSFSIIAGIVLIINIFVMLGEERKSEMGMARAVGMQSKHLVRMYLFEGSIYAFLAAFVGGLLGLGLGRALIYAFDFIFSAMEEVGGGSVDIPFYFEWDSVILAMCMGLIITFITIFFISKRISKLNIIRAIRRIPEPKKPRAEKRMLVMGGLMVFLSILFIYLAFSTLSGSAWMIGYPLFVLSLALIANKWVSIRSSMTAAGFAIIIMFLQPYPLPVISEMNFSGMEAFVLSGVFLVLAGVLIVMFNSHVLLIFLQKTVGRGKSTRAVLKTAISYPMDNKFKTGMTLGMFALIIFTVTVIAMIAAMQASIGDNMLKEQSGGYDIIGMTNPRTPFQNLTQDNLPPELSVIDIRELETISSAVVNVIDYDRQQVQGTEYGPPTSNEDITRYDLLGVSHEFMANNGFSLDSRDANFTSDRDAWLALDENSSYCIVDGNRLEGGGIQIGPPVEQGGVYVGGTITITELGQNKTQTLKVIGIMDQSMFFSGIIVKKEIVKNDYGGVDKMIVIKLGPDENADFVAKEFEKAYLAHGLQTYDMKGIINIILSLMNNMMYLMEGFLGIGLLIGIAGIGIISYRNVIERRQQIGVLRAIGFRKGMIAKTFLIETSFITILAILIGIILGIGIGWNIYRDSGYSDQGVSFVIPWGNILAISIFAYIATLIFTFYPSINAAKVPPAEALRYIE
ncbi:MAG: FtsX-like permease family protein [Thermoplasmata archaeon]